MDMNSSMDDMGLLRQAQRSHHHHHHHHPLVDMEEEIHLEMGPADEVDATFAHAAHAPLVPPPSTQDDHKQLMVVDILQQQQQQTPGQTSRKKKKVGKKWRDEWADTYKWAYVDTYEGTTRIFCSVCKEYGRKHRRNPDGKEGSRNMQMSALEEHNNCLLHKEVLRLQMASKDKSISSLERPIYVKDF